MAYVLLTLGVGVAGFVLLILGALTAVAPELVVRLTPVFLFGVVMLSAGFVHTRTTSPRLIRYWLAVIVVTATLWPSYMAVRVGGLPSIDLRKIAFGVSVLLLLYLAVARPVISTAWGELASGAKWLVACVLLYGTLRIVSALGSPAPVAAFLAVAWEWVYYYIPFFVVLFMMRGPSAREQFMKLVGLLAALVFALALYERITGMNPLVRFAPVSSESADLIAALNLSRLRDGVFRAQATFEHPLMLAEFAAMAAAFAMARVLSARGAMAKLVSVMVFGASVGAALLSGSRVALVSIAIVVSCVALATMVRARHARQLSSAIATRLFVLLSVLGFAAVSVPLLQGLLLGRTSTEASSSSARVQMIKDGVPAMLEAPFFGKGYGQAVFEAGVQGTGGLLTLDNYLLTVGIDSGVPALLLFVAIFMVPAWMAFKRITEDHESEQTFLIGAMAALLGLLTVRMILSIPYNLVFAFVLAALVCGAVPKRQRTYGR